MTPDLPYSISDGYFKAFHAAFDKCAGPVEREKIADKFFGRGRPLQTLLFLAQMDSLHREICLVLEDLAPRSLGFINLVTIEQLVINVKMYVISWMTLIDMLAGLINHVFNLGIAERDIKLEVILRDEHVASSGVSGIWKKYRSTIKFGEIRTRRNTIVHRGKIGDSGIQLLIEETNRLESRRFSLLTSSARISDEEYKEARNNLYKRLVDLTSLKQAFYMEHYGVTLQLFSDMFDALARKRMADP